ARPPRDQHPAGNDADLARARHRAPPWHRFRRAGALDGGERRMRFLSRKDEEPAAVRARRRRRARRHALYLGAGIAAAVGLLATGWYAARSGMLATALAPLQARLTAD